ncbi:hypothetical protein CPB86DRAFT_818425 [Serendipita vermifera]|nr:hypothetical protein CPB86DRAFT_818425 [Serendipita vermifera]
MSTTATRVPPAEPPFRKLDAEEEENVSFVERILRTMIDTAMHYLPQLAIIIICIPVLALISLVAGIIVRNSVPQPWERRVFLQYGESPIPAAHFQFPPLVHDQAYDISVHLTVPYTESNVALGNFMTYLTVTTASNKTVVSANRPAAILPQPKRGIIRRLLPIASSLSYTDMTITILPEWTPGTSQVLYGTLEVGRRDGWKSLGHGEGREITVIESYVRGRVLLSGTRRVVGRYPNIAGFMSTIGFFVTSALGLLLCFFRFAAPLEARGPRIGGNPSGLPAPPMVPRTLPGRPDRSSRSSTPTRYLHREPSPMYSDSSSSPDLPTIPTPDSQLLRRLDSSAYVDVTTDEEDRTVSI